MWLLIMASELYAFEIKINTDLLQRLLLLWETQGSQGQSQGLQNRKGEIGTQPAWTAGSAGVGVNPWALVCVCQSRNGCSICVVYIHRYNIHVYIYLHVFFPGERAQKQRHPFGSKHPKYPGLGF